MAAQITAHLHLCAERSKTQGKYHLLMRCIWHAVSGSVAADLARKAAAAWIAANMTSMLGKSQLPELSTDCAILVRSDLMADNQPAVPVLSGILDTAGRSELCARPMCTCILKGSPASYEANKRIARCASTSICASPLSLCRDVFLPVSVCCRSHGKSPTDTGPLAGGCVWMNGI